MHFRPTSHKQLFQALQKFLLYYLIYICIIKKNFQIDILSFQNSRKLTETVYDDDNMLLLLLSEKMMKLQWCIIDTDIHHNIIRLLRWANLFFSTSCGRTYSIFIKLFIIERCVLYSFYHIMKHTNRKWNSVVQRKFTSSFSLCFTWPNVKFYFTCVI